MKRRTLWTGAAVAAVAGLAGAGAGWWRWRTQAPAEGAVERLWQQSFSTPGGEPLSLAGWRGQPLVVNFWASWCPPCVKEMPQFDRFHRTHGPQGWRVVGIAIDRPEAVRGFLAKTPVTFPIAIAGFDGAALMTQLGNPAGGLPFTVMLDRDGQVMQRKLGETDYDELTRWTQA